MAVRPEVCLKAVRSPKTPEPCAAWTPAHRGICACGNKRGLWFRGTGILRLWEIGTAIILQKTCCLYTILAGFDLVLRLVLWAHHCLRRPSGGPAGGYCRSSADPVACGAPRASAAKDRCTFLACGAHLLAEGSLCGRAIVECLLSLAWPLLLGPLASFFFLSFLNPPSKNDDNGPYDRDEGIAQGR